MLFSVAKEHIHIFHRNHLLGHFVSWRNTITHAHTDRLFLQLPDCRRHKGRDKLPLTLSHKIIFFFTLLLKGRRLSEGFGDSNRGLSPRLSRNEYVRGHSATSPPSFPRDEMRISSGVISGFFVIVVCCRGGGRGKAPGR